MAAYELARQEPPAYGLAAARGYQQQTAAEPYHLGLGHDSTVAAADDTASTSGDNMLPGESCIPERALDVS